MQAPVLDTAAPVREDVLRLILDGAFRVHRAFGPGLLESIYEVCLAHELQKSGLSFQRQRSCPVSYDGVQLETGFRLDLVVENHVIVELKSVDRIVPIHRAQLLTYLKLTGLRVGLLLNFNVTLMRDGIQRMLL